MSNLKEYQSDDLQIKVRAKRAPKFKAGTVQTIWSRKLKAITAE